ncbi:hypothetical protein FXB39_13995 [Nocardioides sp. BGMRC 2183]|nr:hypothetical protein FXB39_13995 [Nocardioides sp. BGMRC 2183]
MRLTPAEEWTLPTGRVHTVRPGASDAMPVQTPLSVNQSNHLAALGEGADSVWLAFSCELPIAVDAAALERAATYLLGRHSALQMSAVTGPSGPRGRRHDPATVTFSRTVDHPTSDAEATARVRAHLDTACRPDEGRPAFGLASVEHRHGSTVVAGFDHLHVDAVSLPTLLRDVVSLLVADPASVAPAGCFVSRARVWAAAPAVPSDDPRLKRWHELLALTGDRLPTFPFDLGVAPGERAPQSTTTHDLADAAMADRLTRWAHAHDASTAAACVAALARALRGWGATGPLALLMPVQTRTPEEVEAVGWFTTTVPVVLDPTGSDPGPRGAAEAIASGMEAAALPLDQVLASLPRPLLRERADVFMVSYVDYRRLPAHDLARRLDARHVSAPTSCDDLQLWLARTDDGLHVRTRAPRTRIADRLVPAILQSWAEEIRTPR